MDRQECHQCIQEVIMTELYMNQMMRYAEEKEWSKIEPAPTLEGARRMAVYLLNVAPFCQEVYDALCCAVPSQELCLEGRLTHVGQCGWEAAQWLFENDKIDRQQLNEMTTERMINMVEHRLPLEEIMKWLNLFLEAGADLNAITAYQDPDLECSMLGHVYLQFLMNSKLHPSPVGELFPDFIQYIKRLVDELIQRGARARVQGEDQIIRMAQALE